ncbi:hypothetical protein P2318_24755 [Myxococcaceae bacterium GXIMD 01537]
MELTLRRTSALVWVMLWTGCAHHPATPPSPQELARQASQAYWDQDFRACAEKNRQAAEASPDEVSRADAFYNAAACASLAGSPREGLALLERAIESGYVHAASLEADPELEPLHALEGWKAVKDRARVNLAKAPNPPPAVPTLAAVDIYGSRRVDPETVRRTLGFETGQPYVGSGALNTRREAELKKRYALAFAKISQITYHGGAEAGRTYLTVDLVDAEDAQRLRFLPEPSGHPADPEGLIARWREYEDKAWQLVNRGELQLAKVQCRILHCALGFDHTSLEGYEPAFVEKVPAHVDALARVLHEDADPKNRAAAAFLLAYAPEPASTTEHLRASIRDPSSLVRNNVLRVMGALQRGADRPLVALDGVLDALALPETTDRNKALSLLKALLEKMSPEALAASKATLVRRVGPQLVALTALRQPINRDPARDILQRLSGEAHETPEAWREWLSRQPE